MAMECEIDRLSALPDNILTYNILSRLSLRDVVRTSVLSTRWRSVWKLIPHLDFPREFFRIFLKSFYRWRGNENRLKQKVKYINDTIDNILLHHSGHIERFSFDALAISGDILNRLRVDQWIQYAALKEVKHMHLKTFCTKDIPPSLFACRLLSDLELHNFGFRGITTEFDGFRSLQSCSLSRLHDLMDDGLEQLIRLCPLLHKLVLADCPRLSRFKIQAPNLNSLTVEHFYDMVSLTADCPQLVELAVRNCGSLMEFKINSCVPFHDLHTSDVQIPNEHPMLNSLRKLSVKVCFEVSVLTLVTTLGYFPNLEEVHIEMSPYDRYFYSEEKRATDETVVDSTFPSLKKAYIHVSSAFKKEEAIMLALLLNNAPSLNTIIVTLPYSSFPEDIHGKEFRNKVLNLQQIYEKVDIRMEIDEAIRNPCRGTYEYSDKSDEDDDNSDYVGSDHCGSDDDALNAPPRLFTLNFR